jgi:hypothetical protein
MPEEKRPPIESLLTPELITEAFRQAFRELVEEYRLHGWSMVGWEDGKVVWIPADQLPAPE